MLKQLAMYIIGSELQVSSKHPVFETPCMYKLFDEVYYVRCTNTTTVNNK